MENYLFIYAAPFKNVQYLLRKWRNNSKVSLQIINSVSQPEYTFHVVIIII
jgi:hypothetical protein